MAEGCASGEIPTKLSGNGRHRIGFFTFKSHGIALTLHRDPEHRSLNTERKLNNLKEEDYEEDE
jgi:hypothetical protein